MLFLRISSFKTNSAGWVGGGGVGGGGGGGLVGK